MNKQELLILIDGKTDKEIKQILQSNYNISWENHCGTCKSWYAKVFTYCSSNQLEEELNFFLWLINFFAPLFHVCFHVEDTVLLGSNLCGRKQTILYYSLTRDN